MQLYSEINTEIFSRKKKKKINLSLWMSWTLCKTCSVIWERILGDLLVTSWFVKKKKKKVNSLHLIWIIKLLLDEWEKNISKSNITCTCFSQTDPELEYDESKFPTFQDWIGILKVITAGGTTGTSLVICLKTWHCFSLLTNWAQMKAWLFFRDSVIWLTFFKNLFRSSKTIIIKKTLWKVNALQWKVAQF